MARANLKPESDEAVAFRLEATRLALGYPQKAEFCRQLKIEPQKWSNAIGGHNAVPRDILARLRERFGITSDWILYGDLRLIPADLARSIAAAEDQLSKEPKWRAMRA